jgi:hypothetical protein
LGRPPTPRADRLDLDRLVALAELHHRALAEGALDLAQGGFERLLLVHVFLLDEAKRRRGHGVPLSYSTAGDDLQTRSMYMFCSNRQDFF